MKTTLSGRAAAASPPASKDLTRLRRENAALHRRIDELERTLNAIRCGTVDALVVDADSGAQLYVRSGAEQPYRSLVEDMAEGAATLASDGTLLYCNRRFAEFVGTPGEQVIGTPVTRWIAPEDAQTFEALLDRARSERCVGECTVQAADGTRHAALVTLSVFQFETRLDCFCLTVNEMPTRATDAEVQELRRRLEQQRHLAQTDPLTNILNRRGLRNAIAREAMRAGRYAHTLSVAFIDLDDFKKVNDRLGHRVGDDVLRAVARTVVRHIRIVDTVGRLGGDEFVVIFPETDHRAAKLVVDRLLESLSRAMGDAGWDITFSIGVVTCTSMRGGADQIVSVADQAMYAAKARGKNQVVYVAAPVPLPEVRGYVPPRPPSRRRPSGR